MYLCFSLLHCTRNFHLMWNRKKQFEKIEKKDEGLKGDYFEVLIG